MLSIKFDFHCNELWHIDAFERAVKKTIKGVYSLVRDKRREFDPIVQDYHFSTRTPIHFFEVGVVLAIVYESIQNGTISNDFKAETDFTETFTDYEIV